MVTAASLPTALRSALRVGVYAGATRFARLLTRGPRRAVDRRIGARQRAQALALHREILARPEAARALSQGERDDLWQLPRFLWEAPADLIRFSQRGARAPRVVGGDGFPYPPYYLHAFHHQRNGGLSRSAALTYEWQIRFVFLGTNRLMRQAMVDALPPGSGLEVLDLACGPGAWMASARAQGRHHPMVGVDLSPHYLAAARARGLADVELVQANAEALPLLWSGRFDVVACTWLYHELPAAARERVTHEVARVLKPRGRLLMMEAVQAEDLGPEEAADAETINGDFAEGFNEPYFMSYQKDLHWPSHLAAHGLEVVGSRRVYASKLIEAHKSGRASE